mgnify:CR=1 FL=1
MKSIIALEKMIKDLEVRIAISKGQLARHNSGEEKLSLLAEASADNSLETHTPLLDEYRSLMKELEKFEKSDSYEHRRLRSAVERKKYYKYNVKKAKKQKLRENDERIEAAMIIDELPEEIILDNQELFEMSTRNMHQYLIFTDDSKTQLNDIQEEFNTLIKGFTDENIKSLELLNYMIPILIFHFVVFVQNIIEFKNNESEDKIIELDFFPRYHDWWINELWESHISYFSLMKWKNDVAKACLERKQEKAWTILFNNWIFIKTLINEKSELAFEYQYIFDSLLKKYVKLESELDKKIVKNSKKEMQTYIESEDLLSLLPQHHVLTAYVKYKKSNKKNI